MALLSANFDPPTAPDANLILPELRILSAILNPCSLFPRRFSFGTGQSVKKTCLVDDPFMPSFFSSSPYEMPSNVLSTMKADKFLSSSIFAKTINKSANPALVIHIFCPLITY